MQPFTTVPGLSAYPPSLGPSGIPPSKWYVHRSIILETFSSGFLGGDDDSSWIAIICIKQRFRAYARYFDTEEVLRLDIVLTILHKPSLYSAS